MLLILILLCYARSGIESELLADLNLEYKMRYACYICVPFLYGGILWFKVGQTLSFKYILPVYILYMGLVVRKPDFVACEKQRRRPACAFTQTDHCLCYSFAGVNDS